MTFTRPPVVRFLGSALASTVGWMVGFFLSFVPAQRILTDPALQSEKMLAAFAGGATAPRIDAPQELILVVLVISFGLVLGYRLSRPDPTSPWWRRGLRFGALAWLLMVPWFELYLPWNVLHEPMPLVLLEAGCWWITLTCSALAISAADGTRK